MIEFDSVTKRYRENIAVKDISFTVKDGEFLFLVGSSGSGKSTLIRLLSAEDRVTSGKIRSNGYDLSTIRRSKIPYYRRTVGVVFQDFRLIQCKTVEENLAFVMRAIGTDAWFIPEQVEHILRMVGLTNMNKRLPKELSGGEQQRVAIARALINCPAVVVADEPTGNLDPKLSREIMELFERVNDELKTTVIVVTHERGIVREMNKRVISLDGGRMIDDYQGIKQERCG